MSIANLVYTRPADAVAKELGTSAHGLSASDAAARAATHGPNALPQSPPESAWHRLARQFADPMIYVLAVAGIVTAVLGEWIDTGVIAAVIAINGIVGFIQEGKAADALAAIRNMLSPHSEVRRDGQWITVDSSQLVPGDVVRLRAGDKVPADLRLAQSTGLRIEEAALTGESVPADKTTDSVHADANLGDRTCMAYSGTTVVAGNGWGYVTGTGRDTEIGSITTLIDSVDEQTTPLTRSLAALSRMLAFVCVGLAAVMMAVSGLVHHVPLADTVLAGIGFAVAAIPEGLPAVVAITLALGVEKMAGRNAIARRMTAVEALGSVTTICSDKTGTLTLNEMIVRQAYVGGTWWDVAGEGYSPEGGIEQHEGTEAAGRALDVLGEIAVLCANADLSKQDDGHWALVGEPTDGAIHAFGHKLFQHAPGTRLEELPFDSAVKYMATVDRLDTPWCGHEVVCNLKGAPDRVLALCSEELDGRGERRPLDAGAWKDAMEAMAARGLRVLAAARRAGDSMDVDTGGFCLVGFWGIVDPPRPEVIDAVAEVRGAGIQVRMITGDHGATATAIAREIGIGGDKAVTGAELEAATDDELRALVRDTYVFARTSPEHKIRLVKALQANGEVVSMTGDGVNDAPSLRQADVGVAMGIKGTEATKEAADIVLADDNFATIAQAVRSGRTIYDNLRKSILFMLPTNGAQGLVIFVAMLMGWQLPMTPVQVLWVNLITAITLSLSLSFEPAEPGIMARPPRDPKVPLLNRSAMWQIVLMSAALGGVTIGAFVWAQSAGLLLAEARTAAVTTLVVAQIFYLLSARRTGRAGLSLLRTNPVSWAAIAVMLALQAAFVYVPVMNTAFRTAALSGGAWGLAAAVGAGVFVVAELGKLTRRS